MITGFANAEIYDGDTKDWNLVNNIIFEGH